MSRPRTSPPSGWPLTDNGPWRAISAMLWKGSPMPGSREAPMARTNTKIIQATAIQAAMPMPPLRCLGTSHASSASRNVVGSDRTIDMSGPPADARIEDRVQEVEAEVHQHVDQRHHDDGALQRQVLPGGHRLADHQAHARDEEQLLDHQGAADQ